MSDRGEIVQFAAVRFERRLPGPRERVWDFLTRTEKLPAWFGEGTIEARAGGAVTLMDGHIRGVVTQFRPPRFLAHTWNVFDPGQSVSDYPESYLQFELSGDDEVRLTLTHFPIPERFQNQTCMGWHTFLDLVAAAADGNTGVERGELSRKNATLYGVDLDNLAR